MTGLKIPRVVIGGTHSGVGKTVLSIGIMMALADRGLRVAPYKVGPDYIDPMYHRAALGVSSRNLDSFMMDGPGLLNSFGADTGTADMAVVEGVMGLFDSHDALDEMGSTAHVAKSLKAPLILIADAERTGRSIAALVKGFKEFDRELDLAGVILNRVGSERHRRKVVEAVERLAGLEVLGAVPRDSSLHIPERHLGLVPAHEIEGDLSNLPRVLENHVDLDRLLEIARGAPELEIPGLDEAKSIDSELNVGVIYDRAFRFYYTETLRQLEGVARVFYIDALKDKALPELDLLYIGGGFPEVFAEGLEKNRRLREEVYRFCQEGGRVYAECGGLMYLGESITNKEGEEFEMVGFLPIATEMMDRYVGMGYTKNTALKDNLLCKKGETIVGHEFHHSKVKLSKQVDYAFKTERGRGIDGTHDGIIKENVLAGYMHVHPLGYKSMVGSLLTL